MLQVRKAGMLLKFEHPGAMAFARQQPLRDLLLSRVKFEKCFNLNLGLKLYKPQCTR